MKNFFFLVLCKVSYASEFQSHFGPARGPRRKDSHSYPTDEERRTGPKGPGIIGRNLLYGALIVVACLLSACSTSKDATSGWVSLFDGKSLSGWKVNESPATFSVQDGAIVANGNRAHLFYDGSVANHNFKNFEFKAQVMTFPNSNAGIYFHTDFQEEGWPKKGYEVQVNNTHTDWRRTGGLYAIDDVKEAPAKDNEWFTQHIVVQGKHVKVMIDGKTVVDYTEPDNPERPESMAQRLISSGTIALQGHDPGSKVLFKDIMVKILK